ncbi:MAG: adenylate/guanylate cyclase domain-containing protein [Pseudomonadota bacterium]
MAGYHDPEHALSDVDLAARMMPLRGHLAWRPLIEIGKIGLWAAAIGAGIGALRAPGDTLWLDTLSGMLTGAFIGLGAAAAETYGLSNPRLRIARRMPPVLLMGLRAVFYGGLILAGLSLSGWIVGVAAIWARPDFWEVFAISAAVAIVLSTAVEITRLLGKEATIALVTGRYTYPRLEDRVILFADVIGSTPLAERVGDVRFHDFLCEVAQDLAEAVDRARGDVHRYIGDAVIVTWPLQRGLANGACVRCAGEMHQALADRAETYHAQFGTEARLRIAIHCGQVAAGEIGDWKKEIALLGDTMNTTARIEGAARDLDAKTVLSDALVQRLPAEVRSGLRKLPGYTAAGKQQELVLWAADGV